MQPIFAVLAEEFEVRTAVVVNGALSLVALGFRPALTALTRHVALEVVPALAALAGRVLAA